MTRYSVRPRAPSPPRSPAGSVTTSEEEGSNLSDNTYSVVQDNLSDAASSRRNRMMPPHHHHHQAPARPPKTRQLLVSNSTPRQYHHRNNNHRHFGDSVDPSPTGSVLSSSSNSSVASGNGVEGGELASLYQATRTGGKKKGGVAMGAKKKYDAVTVEEIKAQFQKQIETMLQSQERHQDSGNGNQSVASPAIRNKVQLQVPSPPAAPLNPHPSALKKSHIPSNAERELSGIRDLQRGKSFLEARSAVQKHIEKMFSDSAAAAGEGGGGGSNGVVTASSSVPVIPGLKRAGESIKHTSHGVSHAIPGQDDDIKPPPPMHYGVSEAVIRERKGSNVGGGGRWRSVESLVNDDDDEREINNNRSDLTPHKFRSVGDLQAATEKSTLAGLTRTVVDIDLGEEDTDDNGRRRMKMENAKPWSNAPGGAEKRAAPLPPTSNQATAAAATSSPTKEPGNSGASSSVPDALKKEFVKHKVDYLGALPIGPRATNLASLQRPLKDLYFKYRALRNLGQTNLPGTLEISDTGLTVQYIRELHKGVQEIFNPFPTIAVWAAVKFVHKREVVPSTGGVHHQYAFLPLISDPDSQEKHRLYHDLDFHEVELAADAPHPPVFACVMRRTGVPKQLECHGFVCTSSEDAIIVAANLYQALLETMKRQKADQAKKNRQAKQKQDGAIPPPAVFSDSDGPPVRPPRRKNVKKGTAGESVTSQSSILQRKKSSRGSTRSNKKTATVSVTIDATRRNARALARSDSGRRSIRSNNGGFARRSTRKSGRRQQQQQVAQPQVASPPVSQVGDVYTRVAIPRSKSFMNVGSQYNLQELFRELKEKEGVESIDDVLKKVITPNGISFNEIKPVYRELLLKLAMTMSQDEIFQRSKNIISQEKKKKSKVKETKKEKGNKKSAASGTLENGGVSSSSNTISSFFKMTFSSSSKSNSLAGNGKKGAGGKLSKSNTLSQGSSSYGDSGLGASEGSKSSKPLPNIPTSSGSGGNLKRTISKADISGPVPIGGRAAEDHSKFDEIKLADPPSNDDEDEVYASCCSECGNGGGNVTNAGYESVCNYDTCSCNRLKVEPPTREEEAMAVSSPPIHSKKFPQERRQHPLSSPLPPPSPSHPPPVAKQRNNIPSAKPPAASSNGIGKPARRHLQDEQSDSEIYCDCDAESCASSEKCYCSVRGDPRQQQKHQHRTRVAVTSEERRLHHGTTGNKTIIHCNGDGNDTIRSVSSSSSSSSSTTSCSTCNFHTCDSGSTATDTTCYSIKHSATATGTSTTNSRSSLLSGCESPQTAWRRNSRLTSPHRSTGSHSHSHHHPNYSDTSLVRRIKSGSNAGSGGSSSGCPSCRMHQQQQHYHGGSHDNLRLGGSGAPSSVSNSSSGCSHHSAPSYAAGGRPPRRAGSKVLLVSATDRAGRVVYRGASSTSNLTTLDENAPYRRHHPSPSSRHHGEHHHGRPNSRLHYHSHSHLNLPTITTTASGKFIRSRGEQDADAGGANDDNGSSSILSMKKSAEIAAVFSGARINQTTDIVDELQGSDGLVGPDDTDTDEDSTDAAYADRKTCQHCRGGNNDEANGHGRHADMKNSLGYFP